MYPGGGYTGGTLVSRCLRSQNPWFVKGISWKRHDSMIILYRLTLEIVPSPYNLKVHRPFTTWIHGFLYHFSENRFTVPRKRSSVVSMVRFVKKLLITFMKNNSYNDPDKLVDDLGLTVSVTFLALAFGERLPHSNSMQFIVMELSFLFTMFTN